VRADRELANDAPDPKPLRIAPLDPAAEVHVEGERRHLAVDNADAFGAHTPLAWVRRREQRPGFDGHAEAGFVLQKALLQHGLQGEPWIHEVEIASRGSLKPKLSHHLKIPSQTVVEDQARRRERVVPGVVCEGDVAELEFDLVWIRHRRIGGDKRPVGPAV
jgi:hypothetical protein